MSGRLENTTTCLPIAYGSIAFYLGKEADEYHTHRWTLYLRSPDQTFDLSQAISKVVFQLHPSFSQPIRELTEPPYEVTESGWGEFQATIRIVWKEFAEEQSIILTHGIKLYPKRSTPATNPPISMSTTVPVVSEKYDEVVFTNPKTEFHKMLLSGNLNTVTYPLSHQPNVLEFFRTYGDEEDFQKLLSAKQFLERDFRDVKDRLINAEYELDELKASIELMKGVQTSEVGVVSAGRNVEKNSKSNVVKEVSLVVPKVQKGDGNKAKSKTSPKPLSSEHTPAAKKAKTTTA